MSDVHKSTTASMASRPDSLMAFSLTAFPLPRPPACLFGKGGHSAAQASSVHMLPETRDSAFRLPPQKGSRAYRYLRWDFGSVYRRIFTLVFAGNVATLIVLAAGTTTGRSVQLTSAGAATAVSANLLAALLVRNEHVVNTMFIVFGPWSNNGHRRLPLALRRLFAKVYSYGGIHSGCGVAATLWYTAFVVMLSQSLNSGKPHTISTVRALMGIVAYSIAVLLVLILVFAHPRARVIAHNRFEFTHRFLGWSVVLLFWAQNLLMAADQSATGRSSYGSVLAKSPSFWMLICITLLVVYPWTHLRVRTVEAEPLSDHCIKLNFSYCSAHYGQAVRLSDAPLKETHAFAVIPNPAAAPSTLADLEKGVPEPGASQASGLPRAGKPGFSVIVSDAGDWTKKIIQNPPTKLYTRGVPQYGVLRIAGLFEPVIVIATGSGIAPCLSLFVEKPNHPVRIIWSAASPLKTFGKGVIDAVRTADPNAVIINTSKEDRPNLVQIANGIWQRSRSTSSGWPQDASQPTFCRPCEAVVIISNQKVTREVVFGLESRGIAAYGAIFDS